MSALGWAMARAALAGALVISLVAAVQAAGALAIGPCGAYGSSFDQAGSDAAQAAAMRTCKGGNCKVVAAISRNCAAFAVDLRNACGSFGFASASRLGLAQNAALRQCYGNGGKDCVIRAFVCDARG
jgi:Domain of unknown function (DUF4189)